jgi:hypothetical protein
MLKTRSKTIPLVSLALILTSGSALAACGSGSSAPSAQSIVSTAFKNAAAGTWVHEVRIATEPGHRYEAHNVIGTSSGRQAISVDGEIMSVIVVPGAAYIKGNEQALVKYFDIKTKHPNSFAGKWIAIKPTDSGYATVRSPVLLATDFQAGELLGPLTRGSDVMLDGQNVLPITGHVEGQGNSTAPATLYVTTTGTVLPVEFKVVSGSVISRTVWSERGEAVSIVAPKPTIPVSKIVG